MYMWTAQSVLVAPASVKRPKHSTSATVKVPHIEQRKSVAPAARTLSKAPLKPKPAAFSSDASSDSDSDSESSDSSSDTSSDSDSSSSSGEEDSNNDTSETSSSSGDSAPSVEGIKAKPTAKPTKAAAKPNP